MRTCKECHFLVKAQQVYKGEKDYPLTDDERADPSSISGGFSIRCQQGHWRLKEEEHKDKAKVDGLVLQKRKSGCPFFPRHDLLEFDAALECQRRAQEESDNSRRNLIARIALYVSTAAFVLSALAWFFPRR